MLPLLAAALIAVESTTPVPVCVEMRAEASGLEARAISDALVVEQRKLGVDLEVRFAQAGEHCPDGDEHTVVLRVLGSDSASLEAPGRTKAQVSLETVAPVDRAPTLARAIVELGARRPLDLGPLAGAPELRRAAPPPASAAHEAPPGRSTIGPWVGLALLVGSHLDPSEDDVRAEISVGMSLLDETLLLRAYGALRPETKAGTEAVPVDLAAAELGAMAHIRLPAGKMLLGVAAGGGLELLSLEARPTTRLTSLSRNPRPGIIRLELEAVFRSGPLRPRVGLGLRRYLGQTELTWLSEPVYAVPAWGAHLMIGLELLP